MNGLEFDDTFASAEAGGKEAAKEPRKRSIINVTHMPVDIDRSEEASGSAAACDDGAGGRNTMGAEETESEAVLARMPRTASGPYYAVAAPTLTLQAGSSTGGADRPVESHYDIGTVHTPVAPTSNGSERDEFEPLGSSRVPGTGDGARTKNGPRVGPAKSEYMDAPPLTGTTRVRSRTTNRT